MTHDTLGREVRAGTRSPLAKLDERHVAFVRLARDCGWTDERIRRALGEYFAVRVCRATVNTAGSGARYRDEGGPGCGPRWVN